MVPSCRQRRKEARVGWLGNEGATAAVLPSYFGSWLNHGEHTRTRLLLYIFPHCCSPGKTRFFNVSVPVALALTSRMLASMSAFWPAPPHSLSWRSYLLSVAILSPLSLFAAKILFVPRRRPEPFQITGDVSCPAAFCEAVRLFFAPGTWEESFAAAARGEEGEIVCCLEIVVRHHDRNMSSMQSSTTKRVGSVHFAAECRARQGYFLASVGGNPAVT